MVLFYALVAVIKCLIGTVIFIKGCGFHDIRVLRNIVFDWVYAKYEGKQGNEQPATSVFGSGIKNTAKSNRVSRNFNDTPIPFDTQRGQNGASGNKRGQDDTCDSDEDDDFSRLIKVRAVANEAAAAARERRFPEGTVIIEDSVEEDGKVYQVFWLISVDQAILLGDETCAAALNIGLKQVREGARKYLSLSDAARRLLVATLGFE